MGNIFSNEQDQEVWTRVILDQLSPRIGEFGAAILVNEIEPLIQRLLQRPRGDGEDEVVYEESSGQSTGAANFRFERTDLGTVPPRISNVEVLADPNQEDGSSNIAFDFDVEYLGDCDLRVSILGVGSGVRDVQVAGRCRLVLKPILNDIPFIGGLQLCFLDPPHISFDLDGLANVCDWPLLKRKVRREILEDATNHCVYPNRINVPLTSKANLESVKAFNAKGIFFLRVVRAEGLPKKGGIRSLVGQGKPDCYVVVNIGAMQFSTAVVKNSCDPSWPDNPWFEFPLETRVGHEARVRLFDHDSLSRDEFLGKASFRISDTLDQDEFVFDLEGDANEKSKYDDVTGQIFLQAKWIDLVPSEQDVTVEPVFQGQETMAILSVFVHNCHNIDDLAHVGLPSSRLIVSVGDVVRRSSWIKDSLHPPYGFDAQFLLRQDQVEMASVSFSIVDKTDTILIHHVVTISDIIGRPFRQLMVVLDQEHNRTMTLSAKVDVLSE